MMMMGSVCGGGCVPLLPADGQKAQVDDAKPYPVMHGKKAKQKEEEEE